MFTPQFEIGQNPQGLWLIRTLNHDGSPQSVGPLEAFLSYVRDPESSWACGAKAVNGTCILPRGHNRGRLDLPSNHLGLPAEEPAGGDPRDSLHAKCDCVPDLGPAHCHHCSRIFGRMTEWRECSAVLEVRFDVTGEEHEWDGLSNCVKCGKPHVGHESLKYWPDCKGAR